MWEVRKEWAEKQLEVAKEQDDDCPDGKKRRGDGRGGLRGTIEEGNPGGPWGFDWCLVAGRRMPLVFSGLRR